MTKWPHAEAKADGGRRCFRERRAYTSAQTASREAVAFASSSFAPSPRHTLTLPQFQSVEFPGIFPAPSPLLSTAPKS